MKKESLRTYTLWTWACAGRLPPCHELDHFGGPFMKAHPEFLCRDRDGNPIRHLTALRLLGSPDPKQPSQRVGHDKETGSQGGAGTVGGQGLLP